MSEKVKPGYKQTEVGVIPEDWNVHTLRSCLSAQPDYGINAPAVPFSDKLPAYIRITDITEDGRFSSDNPVSVQRATMATSFLHEREQALASHTCINPRTESWSLLDS
jgi:type I restriction enzyme S subunit